MDLLICAYPLFLTHQYYADMRNTTNLPLLTVWFSTFTVISLAENTLNIDNLPFYWIIKPGVMLSLYSSNYREWLTQNALSTVTSAGNRFKNAALTIIDEHFPAIKQYIPTISTQNNPNNPNESNVRTNNGWFGGWFK